MQFLRLLAEACFVALIAYNVTNQSVFKEFRYFFKKYVRITKLHDLIECHYCFSHWVTFAVVTLYHERLFFPGFGGWALAVSVVIVMAQPIMIAMDWSIDIMNSFFLLFAPHRHRADMLRRQAAECSSTTGSDRCKLFKKKVDA